MRLVIDLLGFTRGKSYGFEEFICNILSYFRDNIQQIKADKIIIAINSNQKTFFEQSFGNAFDYYTDLSPRCIIDRIYYSSILPKRLSLNSDDILFHPGNTMPLRRPKCINIVTIHDLLYHHKEFCSKSLYFTLFRLRKSIYVPNAVKKANRIIAISEFTKKELITYYKGDSRKIEVVYNYFNFKREFRFKP